MIQWNYSGASTKFIYHVSITEEILKEHDLPDFITGVSSGSIAALPIALCMIEEAKELGIKLKLPDFMDESPMTDKGKLTFKAKCKLFLTVLGIKKYKSLGIQNVIKILRTVITKKIFEAYQDSSAPVVLITAFNVDRQEKVIWNIKSKRVDYETYLKAVAASAAIPFATQAITIEGEEYFDTGMRDHIATDIALDYITRTFGKVTEIRSFYARPDKLEKLNFDDLKKIAASIYTTAMHEISKSDERIEALLCELNNIKLTQYFAPYTFKDLYNVNEEDLKKLYEDAKDKTLIKTFKWT